MDLPREGNPTASNLRYIIFFGSHQTLKKTKIYSNFKQNQKFTLSYKNRDLD